VSKRQRNQQRNRRSGDAEAEPADGSAEDTSVAVRNREGPRRRPSISTLPDGRQALPPRRGDATCKPRSSGCRRIISKPVIGPQESADRWGCDHSCRPLRSCRRLLHQCQRNVYQAVGRSTTVESRADHHAFSTSSAALGREDVGGIGYLSSLLNTVPPLFAIVEYYGRIVEAHVSHRRLIDAGA